MPVGMSMYVRRYTEDPEELAQKFADNGAKWIAIAGPWQDPRRPGRATTLINSPQRCQALAKAAEERGLESWIWGYPWQGLEEDFAKSMRACAGDHSRALLDPELGSNPERESKGAGKQKANAHAHLLVREMKAQGFHQVGLSTFGNGWRIGWFPLLAFTKALLEHYPGLAFIGGQTYTDDGVIDRSIADMIKVIERAGGTLADCAVVPNFGAYKWDTGKRQKGSKAIRKLPGEFLDHLAEFIDDGEPVDAMIGWAENFMNDPLWAQFRRFAGWMERGACALPSA